MSRDCTFESLCVVQHLWKDLIFAKIHRVLRRPPEGFYGFATLLDAPDRNAYFQSGDYREPDYEETFSLFNRRRTSETDELDQHFKRSSIALPQLGQTICGIPENGPKGMRFRCWFFCPQEFWFLWHLLLHGPSHPVFKPLEFDQEKILSSLVPNPNPPRHLTSIVTEWPHLFQAIALLLVYRDNERAKELSLPENFIETCLSLYKTL